MTSKNVHTFELKMGKRALVLFILGMSCLLFVVFLFGVSVGKNIDTYPEKYSRGIAGMIMERFGWSSSRVETAAGSIADISKESAKAAGEEKAVPAAVPVGTDEKQSEAIATKEQKAPTMPAAEQAKMKQSSVKGKYQIQVVSLKEKDKADQLLKKLTNLGLSPTVSEMDVPDKGKWYRVTLEGFEDRDQAQKAMDQLTKKIKGLDCTIRKSGVKND